jgi:3-oxoadipate enol-lactonase
VSEFDVHGSDGTRVVCWHNDVVAGIPVVISNGLGTPPQAWPALVAPDSGLSVWTWHYRGTGGGDRPADPARIRVEDHAGDLAALVDATGQKRVLLVCWSVGVNVGFSYAEQHPERVAGILSVAGVPGGLFESMGGLALLPRRLRARAGAAGSGALARAGAGVNAIMRATPISPLTTRVITSTGFVGRRARAHLPGTLAAFREHDFRYYFRMAQAAHAHAPMDLSFVRCPVVMVAGRRDPITSHRAVTAVASQMSHATVRVLPGTHFLPLEFPDEMLDLTRGLARVTGLEPATA